MTAVSEMCDRAKTDGAQELITFLKDSPNGGHNRLDPDDVKLVGMLMNESLNDKDIIALWTALQRDMVNLRLVHQYVADTVVRAAYALQPPENAEQIEAERRAAMCGTGHL